MRMLFWLYCMPWWRHQMETFSALLALCAGNSPVPVNSPHKGQWCGALMFSLICAWVNDWVNNRKAGDLRRHRGHYDVNVIHVYNLKSICNVFELSRFLLSLLRQKLIARCTSAKIIMQLDCCTIYIVLYMYKYRYIRCSFPEINNVVIVVPDANFYTWTTQKCCNIIGIYRGWTETNAGSMSVEYAILHRQCIWLTWTSDEDLCSLVCEHAPWIIESHCVGV